MTQPIRLGVAGLGTVGCGLLRLMEAHAPRLAETVGRHIVVTGVSARSRDKTRGVKLDAIPWFSDPVALAADRSIDVFVELIGGDDGPAKAAVEAALSAGKPVVTANKALLARHGAELARLAEDKGAALNFEAAAAGGIPVIKTLRESLAGNRIRRVYGILNGTCNYILTKMQDEHRTFADERKRDKIAERIVGKLRLRRGDRQKSRRRQQQHRTVTRRLGDDIVADNSGSAGFVVDDHGGLQPLGKRRSDRARNHVVAAARTERHDDFDERRKFGVGRSCRTDD